MVTRVGRGVTLPLAQQFPTGRGFTPQGLPGVDTIDYNNNTLICLVCQLPIIPTVEHAITNRVVLSYFRAVRVWVRGESHAARSDSCYH